MENDINLSNKTSKWKDVLIPILIIIVVVLAGICLYFIIDKKEKDLKDNEEKKSVLTIDLNGGQILLNKSGTYKEGTIVELGIPTNGEYTFVGWEIVSGDSKLNGNKLTIGKEETVVYAKWEINMYKIEYILDGGTISEDTPTKAESQSVVELTTPEKKGYTFKGWTVEGTDAILRENSLTIGTSDITLVANWKINTYEIEYMLDGGLIIGDSPKDGEYKSVIELTIPEKKGYTFKGWTVEGTDAILRENSLTIGTSDITLVANWKINTYKIEYMLDGGVKGTSSPTSAIYGSTLEISKPTKKNYRFVQWDIKGESKISKTNELTVNGDTILIAKWERIKGMDCTFDGELVQGAEYINGQYTYRYMQEYRLVGTARFSWREIEQDGWGVALTDLESTEPVTSKLCATINNKPIVSTSWMYVGSKATSIDLSSLDTSNVVNMAGMFYWNKSPILDLSGFDIGKVKDMSQMFDAAETINVYVATSDDISKFRINSGAPSTITFLRK